MTARLAALALVLLALAGCSDGEEPVAAPSATTTAPTPTPTAPDREDADGTSPAPGGQAPTGRAPTAPPPDPGPVSCPAATVTVSTAEELTTALAAARPGDSIRLADGTYEGKFVATRSGTEAAPVFLCGGAGAVLDAGGVKSGYGFHLDQASWWRLVGFTVRNAQKGVMADGTQHSVFQALTVEDIGDEGLHLRAFSSDNLVVGNTVRRTGQRREKFGEGIYIGSATSNWEKYSRGGPDRSDRNVVRGNSISAVTAEAVDIKEGTSKGVLVGNVFDGSGMTEEGADSWVDVKGNSWLIEGNRGTTSRVDGFQTHDVEDGWGTDNVFRGNTASGVREYGFALRPVLGNRVACDNRVTGGKGLSNVDCA